MLKKKKYTPHRFYQTKPPGRVYAPSGPGQAEGLQLFALRGVGASGVGAAQPPGPGRSARGGPLGKASGHGVTCRICDKEDGGV